MKTLSWVGARPRLPAEAVPVSRLGPGREKQARIEEKQRAVADRHAAAAAEEARLAAEAEVKGLDAFGPRPMAEHGPGAVFHSAVLEGDCRARPPTVWWQRSLLRRRRRRCRRHRRSVACSAAGAGDWASEVVGSPLGREGCGWEGTAA